jgi:hypothetical protein
MVVQTPYMPLQMCVFSILNIFFKKKQSLWPTAVGLAWLLSAAVRLLQPPSATAVGHDVKPNRCVLWQLDLQPPWCMMTGG